MRKALAALALGLVAAFLSGCAGTTASSVATEPGRKTVYVVHHGGLHTGVTIRRSDIPPDHWPASADFARSRYIEVGWGDDDGYRKPLTPGIAIKALIGDPQTVLFAEGFREPIERK